ncbi:uncharacterized protein LOC124913396 [Impatiens glandulifera]|uniref:uncharacterized protein LOC124913396 n=1 Tax=Impatiens glandulifera TaxID=253017 RepID=UPI001FB09B84|nr:uncharacterized protein LOC124913396 [Impatiens glandulifera]
MDGAAAKVISVPEKIWTKAFQHETTKCDIVENNMCESFNSSIFVSREKYICIMLDLIRRDVTNKRIKNHILVHKWPHNISPKAKELLEVSKSQHHECHVFFFGGKGYEITQGNHRHTVDLFNEICSCRLWNISGIPCAHVVRAINYANNGTLEDYVSHWYKKNAYLKTYSFDVNPLRGDKFWHSDCNLKILPPKVGRSAGRPKKKRRRAPEEPKSHGKMSQRDILMH